MAGTNRDYSAYQPYVNRGMADDDQKGGAHSIYDARLNLWTSRRQRSQELKQLYEGDWTRFWRWYRNYTEPLDDPVDWWRSNENIPTPFKIIETLLPRSIMGMFESPDWFRVQAQQRRDEMYETMCEQLIRTSIENMGLFPKLYEAFKYAAIMGHCWGKCVWKEEWTERQVLMPTPMMDPATGQPYMGVKPKVVKEESYNDVEFEWLTLDRVFPDPTGEGDWYIEEIDTTIERLEEVQKYLKVYDKEQFAGLVANHPAVNSMMQSGDSLSDARSGTSAGVSVEYSREPEVTEGIPNHYVTPMRDGIGVKLWQCWGWVPPEARVKDKSAWRLTVIADGKYLLRDEPSPTPDGRPPYFAIKSVPIPKRLYGDSILRYIGPLADQQTRLANMRLDEVYLGIWQQYLYRSNAVVSDNQLLMQPGGAIEVQVDNNQSIKDVFSKLERDPVLPDAYTEDMYRQTQAEHAAAAQDVMQGVSSGDRTTATEVERKVQQGNARHQLYAMWNDYTVKKELLERIWGWLQSRLTSPRIIRTVGEEYAQVDVSQIQVPIDIVVAGGFFAMSKDQRLQMDQELIGLASSPMFGPYFKPHAVLRQLMMDRGWRDPERFIKTQEEMMLEQAMMAAGQAGMAQQLDPQQQGGNGEQQQQPGPDGNQQGQAAQAAPTDTGSFMGGGQGGVSQVSKPGNGASMAGGVPRGTGAPIATTGV